MPPHRSQQDPSPTEDAQPSGIRAEDAQPTEQGVSDDALACGRALDGPDAFGRSKWSGHIPDPGERARLASTLGVLLRELRAEYDIGTRPLARRSTVARSTISRLESGQRRPRPAVLAAIAYGLDPDRAPQIAQALQEAAGESLRPDTPAGVRSRSRRLRKARLAAIAERASIAREAQQAGRAAFMLSAYTLRDIPVHPPANATLEALQRERQQLDTLTATLDRARQLDVYRDALTTALRRPCHPLEVNILDWHTARQRARKGS